jgi:hypothetical protein
MPTLLSLFQNGLLKVAMKKFFKALCLIGICASFPLLAEITPEEKKGHELCLFAEDVFNALADGARQNKVKTYEHSSDPIIQNLAEKFNLAFEETSIEETQMAVTELGRLLKCAVDNNYRLPYVLHRKELEEKSALMEKALKGSLPKNPNYHKLMIESLADKKWDIALYSYIKITEERCVD